MRIERILWATLSVLLLSALGVVYKRYGEIQYAVLSRSQDSAYVEAAASVFSKSQGSSRESVKKDFYITFLGLTDRSCIRFVPRPNVTGGTPIYCFTNSPPLRLISSDVPLE